MEEQERQGVGASPRPVAGRSAGGGVPGLRVRVTSAVVTASMVCNLVPVAGIAEDAVVDVGGDAEVSRVQSEGMSRGVLGHEGVFSVPDSQEGEVPSSESPEEGQQTVSEPGVAEVPAVEGDACGTDMGRELPDDTFLAGDEELDSVGESPAAPSVENGVRELALGEPGEVELGAGTPAVFAFTADQDGTYVFEGSGELDIRGALYADEGLSDLIAENDGEGPGFEVACEFAVGQTVWLSVRPCLDGASGAARVSVSRADASSAGGQVPASEEQNASEEATDTYDLGGGLYGLDWSGSLWVSPTGFEGPHDIAVQRCDGEQAIDPSYWSVVWADSEGAPIEGEPTEPGSYILIIEGSEPYHGVIETPVEVGDGFDLGGGRYFADCSSEAWVTPEGLVDFDCSIYYLVGIDGDTASLDLSCWSLRWRDAGGNPLEGEPTEPGTYTAALEGCGGYWGELTCGVELKDGFDLGAGLYSMSFSGTPRVTPEGFVGLGDVGVYCWGGVNEDWRRIDLDPSCWELSWRDSDGNPLEGDPAEPGTYTLVVEGCGVCRGELTCAVEVKDALDLGGGLYSASWYARPYVSLAGFTGPQGLYVYNSSDYARLNSSCWRIAGWLDAEGNAIEGEPTEAGTYAMVLEGCGQYHGELVREVEVLNGLDLGCGMYSMTCFGTPYISENGFAGPETIRIYASYGGTSLAPSCWKIVGWRNADGNMIEDEPTEPGRYTLVIEGCGDYHGELTESFDVPYVDLYDISTSVYSAYDNTGMGGPYLLDGELHFNLRVTGPGIDSSCWSLSWLDAEGNAIEGQPAQPGRYTAVIEGVAPYYGTRTVGMTVRDAYDISLSYYYSAFASPGSVHPGSVSAPRVAFRSQISGLPETLTEGKHYTATWTGADGGELPCAPTEPGTYSVVLEGIAPYHGTRTLQTTVEDHRDLGQATWGAQGLVYLDANGELVFRGMWCSFRDISADAYTVTWLAPDGSELPGGPTEPGDYTVRCDGTRGYIGSGTAAVKVGDWYDISFGWCVVQGSANVTPEGLSAPVIRSYLRGPDNSSWLYRPAASCEITGWLDAYGRPVDGEPSAPGSYYAVVEGRNGYYGTAEVPVGVSAPGVAACQLIVDEVCVVDGELRLSNPSLVSPGTRERVPNDCWSVVDFTLSTGVDPLGQAKGGSLVIEGAGEWADGGRLVVTLDRPIADYDSPDRFSVELGGALATDGSGAVHFTYTGSDIDAGISVVRDLPAFLGGPTTLAEGTDYEVELSERVGDPDGSVEGVATVRGLGRFTFEKEVPYVIDALVAVSDLAGRASVTDGTASFGPGEEAWFFAGRGSVPVVAFDEALGLEEGVDYELSYFRDGNPVENPTQAGTGYSVRAEALPGGRLSGSVEFPFDLVETKSLSGITLMPEGAVLNGVPVVPDVDRPGWSFGGLLEGLVEGVDYVVDKVYLGLFGDAGGKLSLDADGNVVYGESFTVASSVYGSVVKDVYGFYYDVSPQEQGAWKITVTGKGDYEGSVSTVVREMAPQEDFTLRPMVVNGVAYRRPSSVCVEIRRDGSVVAPEVLMDGLEEGRDYVAVGVGNQNVDMYDDSLYSWSVEGRPNAVWLRVKGLGDYEGCTRIVMAHTVFVDTPSVPDDLQVPDPSGYERAPRGYARLLYAALLGNLSPTEAQLSWWEARLSSGTRPRRSSSSRAPRHLRTGAARPSRSPACSTRGFWATRDRPTSKSLGGQAGSPTRESQPPQPRCAAARRSRGSARSLVLGWAACQLIPSCPT